MNNPHESIAEFDPIASVRPDHSRNMWRPPWTSCWQKPMQPWKPSPAGFPAAMGGHLPRTGCCHRTTRHRLGRCQPPQQRGRHTGAAGGLQRHACPRSPSSGPAWVPTSACTPSTRPLIPSRPEPEQRQAHKNAMRNFVLGGADLQGRRTRALCRHPGPQAALAKNSAKTRWMPPTPSATTPPNRDGWRTRRCAQQATQTAAQAKAKTATNSRSKCRATCRSCSLPTAVPCAPRCTAPM
jgi:hypothetical protein